MDLVTETVREIRGVRLFERRIGALGLGHRRSSLWAGLVSRAVGAFAAAKVIARQGRQQPRRAVVSSALSSKIGMPA